MIHRTEPSWQTPVWQQALSSAFTDLEELFEYLGLDKALLPAGLAASRSFRLRVPRGYAGLITKGDPADPLLLQILPQGLELEEVQGFNTDPVNELDKRQATGVLHKYSGRALLITTGACAINCRYCFRRHYPYAEDSAHQGQWQSALNYLMENNEINEVILSGGDPLAMSDSALTRLVESLQRIPHIERLRIHSRLPVVLPERVTDQLLDLLSGTRLQPVMVLHTNHPRELSMEVKAGLSSLNSHGVSLLNQSVLLRDINDDPKILTELSETLFSARVTPYYLHMLDRVQGAAHFEVSEPRAGEIYSSLRKILPGYLLPRLVRDDGEMPYKLPLF